MQASIDIKPISDTPLDYLNPPDAEGYHDHDSLYVIDTPQLRDRYVVRAMRFEDSELLKPLSREQKYAITTREITRLRECGVSVPNFYAALPDGWNGHWMAEAGAGLPTQDVMFAVDRITPVDSIDATTGLAHRQAQRTIDGLTAYLRDSYGPERPVGSYFLSDVFRARNFMYGTVSGVSEPDFYMVDVDGLVHATELDDSYIKMMSGAKIVNTARVFGELTHDPTLQGYAMQSLQSLEIDPDDISHNTPDDIA